MMFGATFKLTGNRELDRKFTELPAKIEKKVLRQALRPSAKLILQAAKANAPSVTGQMKRALRVRAAKRSRRNKNTVTVQVATGKDFYQGEAFYGAFVEFGHRLGSRKLGDSRRMIPGRHFIEGAYKSQAEAAKALALRLIAEGIEREAKTNG